MGKAVWQVGDPVGDPAGAHPCGEVQCVVTELAGVCRFGRCPGCVDARDQCGVQGPRTHAAFSQVQGLLGVAEGFLGAAEVAQAADRGASQVRRGEVAGPGGLLGSADLRGGVFGQPERGDAAARVASDGVGARLRGVQSGHHQNVGAAASAGDGGAGQPHRLRGLAEINGLSGHVGQDVRAEPCVVGGLGQS